MLKRKLFVAGLACAGLLVSVQAYAEAQGKGAAMLREIYKQVDSNGDGQISLDEYHAAALKKADRQFKAMDTNGDGMVSPQEFGAAIAKWKEMQQKNGDAAPQ
jgi:Ca2+-binding EF-hand superfamily protein